MEKFTEKKLDEDLYKFDVSCNPIYISRIGDIYWLCYRFMGDFFLINVDLVSKKIYFVLDNEYKQNVYKEFEKNKKILLWLGVGRGFFFF